MAKITEANTCRCGVYGGSNGDEKNLHAHCETCGNSTHADGRCKRGITHCPDEVDRIARPRWARDNETRVTLRRDHDYDNWIISVEVSGRRTFSRESQGSYKAARRMFDDFVKYCPA